MPDNTAIRPFQVNFPEAEVTELRRRIAATRWPERELVSDEASRSIWATLSAGDTQGVQLATMQKLIQYWGTKYDWSKCEARLKALPALRHRARRARHPFHPREIEASGCLARDHHPRLARFRHRAAQDH
jgi:Epoxide hydrolase N terminus